MNKFIFAIVLITLTTNLHSQSISQIKKELESTPDPLGYVKYKLKKKYKVDTISVLSTSSFLGLADSLAYNGKIDKVYGPFKGYNYLIKIIAKVPNTFYHVSHILIDTTTFTQIFADSLGSKIINRVLSGSSTFESMARTYSSDNASSIKGGDLGWFVRGIMLAQLDKAIASHKKGDVFKVWTEAGLHVVRIIDNPKKDTGFALFLRVFL